MPAESTTSFTLGNGLKFIVAEDHNAPVAVLGLWVRAGVCDEPADRRGIAHFLEHMMFRGSQNFGPKEHTRLVAQTGGSCNAFTSFDVTVFHEIFPSRELPLMFRLEADRFMRPVFSGTSLETEKKVVLEEVRVYENQPFTRAIRKLLRTLGGDHPYALDPLGNSKDVEACSGHDLNTFHRNLYRPRNTFCIVCGDVSPAAVRELAEQNFGAWKDPADLPPPPKVPQFMLPVGRRAERVSIEVPLLARMHRLPPSSEVDYTAMMLLWALLADGKSSPITETLVKQTRLCVEAGAQHYYLVHGGAAIFYGAFLPPGKYDSRHKIIRGICDKMAEHGPDPSQFEEKLLRFRRRFAFDHYSIDTRMHHLGDSELYRGDYSKYNTLLDDIASVTPDRIQTLAQTIFAENNTLELDVEPENRKWYMPIVGLAMKALSK